jgi:hypothetical protein
MGFVPEVEAWWFCFGADLGKGLDMGVSVEVGEACDEAQRKRRAKVSRTALDATERCDSNMK